MRNKKRVLAAMSGGVDSSVAAFLLKKQGYDVVGVTMCFGLADSKRTRPHCCGVSSIKDAQRAAEQLDIRHYVLSFGKHLEEKVIKEFLSQYLSGRTPNPCVLCNQFLKFDLLLKKAKSLGCDYLATGHYVQMVHTRSGNTVLKKARDRKKDQSYFLYRLPCEAMNSILFPIGRYDKDEVRAIARKQKLRVADKPGSQDICFIPDGDYKKFLLKRCGKSAAKPGPIKDEEGHVLGRHQGIMFYTIGQRQGLGIAYAYPLYVKQIQAKTNTIIVGAKHRLYGHRLRAENLHVLGSKSLAKRLEVFAKIRYNHPHARARITVSGKAGVEVVFRKPQWAITPGQSVVFYKNNVVLGGATIERAFE